MFSIHDIFTIITVLCWETILRGFMEIKDNLKFVAIYLFFSVFSKPYSEVNSIYLKVIVLTDLLT